MNNFPNEHDSDTPVATTTTETVPPPIPQTDEPTETPQTEQERPLFVRVGLVYHALLNKMHENQNRVHEQRVQIAALRARIRELLATEQTQEEESSEEDELQNNKLIVQTDDCNNLIRQAEKIRENIHHNSGEAETMLTPLRNSMDLLTARIQYIRTMEALVANVREGIRLQGKLNGADAVLESLERKLAEN